MCGIVGYVGPRDCSDVLVDALTKLEYRGYDSAGIAVFENGEICVEKTKGRLKDLSEKMEREHKPFGHTGIGHTRWATHGKPSDINSHPHSGDNVTVVHNGIIENYLELREYLKSKGKTFVSETDTEVIALLLDYFYAKSNGDKLETIKKVMHRVTGSFALGIMFKDEPDTIYATRRESPLIVGVGNNGDEHFIASDVPAILKYTKNYYLISNNEVAILKANSVVFLDRHMSPIRKDVQIADFDMDAAEKGGYPHFMIKEIHEQPESIKRTIIPRIKDGMPDLSECGITEDKLREFKNIYIVACGTAMHAGTVGKYLIEKLAKVPVTVDIASEFRYRDPLVKKGDLVIIISQSGETADSKAAMSLAKEKGATTLAIVNAKGSSIAREADMLIYTHAGPEIAVASTKAYMVQIAVMYLFTFLLAFAKGEISEEKCKALTKALYDIPDYVENTISMVDEKCKYIGAQLLPADSLLYIGRGLDYALSMEGSLKLKEISYIHSESYAAGELKHGTISLIEQGTPVIAIATQNSLLEKTVSNIKEVKARGAMVVFVCDEECVVGEDVADIIVKVPKLSKEQLMPLLTIVPLQLIAYYTAVSKGNDVDKPRNLAKSVTVE
ncbi:MAG: glutamine--fructose-6-phosphate transaminase (isomerizing) [Acutalibacteraceae bacterium]